MELTTIFPLLQLSCEGAEDGLSKHTILKDGIVLLEHEACQEQPLYILDTFKKRNPARGAPNLCEFYYRMTGVIASQLFHLTDIVKDNSAIRGSNLEDTFTVTLKLSEDVVGSVQGAPSPRTKTKLKKKIFSTNMVILNVKCSQGKLVFKCAALNSSDHSTVLNALTDENDNWSMSVCAQVLNFYRDLLLSNSLQVNGIKFRFVISTCRDGKWLSRSQVPLQQVPGQQ